MTAGSGGSPASPQLFARHRFPFRISLSRRDAPGLARGSWSFLCPLPTVNTRVRRPCSDLTAASSLPRASFPVPAAPRDAEPPSVVRAFVSGSCSLGSCPVRGPPGRARRGPGPCGAHTRRGVLVSRPLTSRRLASCRPASRFLRLPSVLSQTQPRAGSLHSYRATCRGRARVFHSGDRKGQLIPGCKLHSAAPDHCPLPQ